MNSAQDHRLFGDGAGLVLRSRASRQHQYLQRQRTAAVQFETETGTFFGNVHEIVCGRVKQATFLHWIIFHKSVTAEMTVDVLLAAAGGHIFL
jgi:hypothetical protein